MSTHSFICNVCIYYNMDTDEKPNKEKCQNCNGQGGEWQPRNKEKYEQDPHKFMKNLILGSL